MKEKSGLGLTFAWRKEMTEEEEEETRFFPVRLQHDLAETIHVRKN